MSNKTGIEWTDATWNPIRGCSRVSWTGKVELVEKHLLDPLKWKPARIECLSCRSDHTLLDCPEKLTRSRRIFVNSMSDLFHESVSDDTLDRIHRVMILAYWHTFQVLTKRPERRLQYRKSGRIEKIIEDLRRLAGEGGISHRLDPIIPNLHEGTSCEDQPTADKRIPLLLQTPAAVRYVSLEPLLGEIDLKNLNGMVWFFEYATKHYPAMALKDFNDPNYPKFLPLNALTGYSPAARFEKLDWVIVGGESGPGARPMHPDWARSLRDQCEGAAVPFFFKQWGEWLPWEPEHGPCWQSQNGKSEDSHALFPPNIADNPAGWDCGLGFEGEAHAAFQRVGKKAAGALLDGREWREFPKEAR